MSFKLTEADGVKFRKILQILQIDLEVEARINQSIKEEKDEKERVQKMKSPPTGELGTS